MSAEPYVNIKYAKIEQASAGTNTIVSAVPSKKIRVIAYSVSLSAAGTVKFLNTGGADLTGVVPVGTTPATFSGSVYGPAFETTPGVGLDITSVTGSAHGHVTYQEVSV
jgi:hypothetical protein